MRGLAGLWVLAAACAPSVGHAQSDDLRSSFLEIEQFLEELKSVVEVRDDCLRRYPARAADALAAYDKSSASAYPEILNFSVPTPVPPQSTDRPQQDQGSGDEGWKSCLANLVMSLERFDAQYASRSDEIKFIYDNQDEVLARVRARSASPLRDVRSTDVSLSLEGAKVRVARGDAFSVHLSCAFLDNLFTASPSAELATVVLRNETARRGGDTLLVAYTKASASSVSLGVAAFRCN